MKKPARRAAALCALLASTAIAAPAAAQPPTHQNLDANGVDLVDGSYNLAIVEGSIGSGPGAIALMRYYGAEGRSDNLAISLNRLEAGGATTVTVALGDHSETFSAASDGTFVADQGGGATLTRVSASHYSHVARDGTVTTFGLAQGLITSGSCTPATEAACTLVPISRVRPNGAATTFLWEVVASCTPACARDSRQRGVSNNSGYRLRFTFAQEENPTSGAPPEAWSRRTGAVLDNVAQPGSPVRTVGYATPAAGVAQITTDGGDVWRIAHNASENVTAVRRPGSNADNVVIAYAPQSLTRVASIQADGVITNYALSQTGTAGTDLTATMTVTNARNEQTVVVSNADTRRVTSVTVAGNRTTSMQYDANGRVTRITRPEGNYTQFSYDARGHRTQTLRAPKPGHPETPLQTSATYPTNADYPTSCANPVTCNLPLSTTDERGFVTDYTYDQTHGGVLTATAPAVGVGSGSARPQVRTTYAQVGGVHLPETISACPAGGSCAPADEVRTTIVYGANHLPETVTRGNASQSLAAMQSMTYDSAGNLLTVDGPLASDTVRYRYDAARRRVGIVSPDPDGPGPLPPRAQRTTYRPDGQVSRIESGIVNGQSDADWASMIVLEQVDIAYDTSSRPFARSFASGGANHNVIQTGYDELGRPECVTVRMNPTTWSSLPNACTLGVQGPYGPDRITRTFRNAAGEVTQVRTAIGTAAEAAERTIAYRLNGTVHTVTDGENNLTTYTYDGLDRLRNVIYPEEAQGSNASAGHVFEQFGYDASGNVTGHYNRGEFIAYTYDALGRLTSMDRPHQQPDVSFGYDLLGRMVSAAFPDYPITFTYDALGRRLTENSARGLYTSSYDLAGRRTRLTYPDGFFAYYDWLVTGELDRVRERDPQTGQPGLVLAQFGYEIGGRRTSLTRANGTVTTYALDPISRRLQTLSQDLGGASSTHDLSLGFTYTPANQILSNARSNDLYSVTPAAAVQTTTADGLNQIGLWNGNAVDYDSRGNMTLSDEVYTADNLMTWRLNTPIYYDPLGRLLLVISSPWTRFAWDGGDLVGEAETDGTQRTRYVHGGGEVLVGYDGPGLATRTFYHSDERGSVVAHTNSSGAVTAVNRYDEYGLPASGNSGRFQYTGQLWLPEIGLHYYRSRMYNPAIGRFMQVDPIRYGDGMNMYAYVGGDPVNMIDPTGTEGTTAVVDPNPIIVEGTRLGSDFSYGGGFTPATDPCSGVHMTVVLCWGGGGSAAGADAAAARPGTRNRPPQPRRPLYPNEQEMRERLRCAAPGVLKGVGEGIGAGGAVLAALGALGTPGVPDGELVGILIAGLGGSYILQGQALGALNRLVGGCNR